MQFLIKKNFSSLQLTDKVVKGMFGTENFNNNNPPPLHNHLPATTKKSITAHLYLLRQIFIKIRTWILYNHVHT